MKLKKLSLFAGKVKVQEQPGLPVAKGTEIPEEAYKFQLSLNMTVAAAVSRYEGLTFPNIRRQAQANPIREPLVTMVAASQGQPVGMALAEVGPDKVAQIISLYVVPGHRRRGVGRRLLAYLEKALAQLGCQAVE